MPIPVTCPCGVQVQVVDEAAGRQIRCGQCKRLLTVPASACRAVPPPVAASAEVRPATRGMTNRRIVLVCGLIGGLGVVVAGVIGTVVALMLLNAKQPASPVAAAHQSRPEARDRAVSELAPAGNKIVGDVPEDQPAKGVGDALDASGEPIRKPQLPGSDVPIDEGAVPNLPVPPIRKPASRPPDDGAVPKLPVPPARKPDPPAPGATVGLPVQPTKLTFLNSTAEGQRFCIIADNSGSMTGEPLAFLKRELVKSLGDLKSESQFYVMFFSDEAQPMPYPSWLKGTAEDVNKVLPWVRRIQVGGGTQPLTAFQKAFRLDPRPDVIFFMTDGLIPEDVPDVVAALNTGKQKVKINTIMFTSDTPTLLALFGAAISARELRLAEGLLRKIANDSGGAYRLFTPWTPEDVAKAAEAGDQASLATAINYIPRMGVEVRRIIPRLLAALRKASVGTRPSIVAVLRAINFLDSSHVPGLVALLEAPAEDLQMFGLEGLAFLRGEAKKEGLAPLLQLFARGEKSTILLAVIKVLDAVVGPDRSLAEMYRTRGLKKTSRPVRLASLAFLRKIGPEALPSQLLVELAFNDSDADMRHDAQAIVAERMKGANEGNLPDVRALLKMKRSSEAVQLGLLGVARLGPKAKECLPEVLEAFAGEDAKVREAGVPALRAMGPAAREAVGSLTSRLPKSPPEQQREIALVLAALDPANPEIIKLIVPLLVQNLHPDTLPDKQGPPPEMLLQSIKEMGEPTVEIIFATLEEATGQRGAVAANHRKFLFLALERLGKVAYSKANLQIVTRYTSPKKEIYTDVRTAAGKARRAMVP